MRFSLKIFYQILALILLVYNIECLSQEQNDTLKILNKHFQSFEYDNTISTADSLLLFRSSFSNDLLLEIFRIKAIAHFSLLQDKLAGESFFEILKIDSSYTLDSATTSPKIISFFGDIKNQYLEEVAARQNANVAGDTVFVTRLVENPETSRSIKNAIVRSIVLPGWGHLYQEESFKGILLTSLSLIGMASSLYFIIDSNKKEDAYEKAFNLNDIAAKYDSFNRSYKFRNYSLISLAAVWLYSQIDLLLLSDDTSDMSEASDVSINTGIEIFPESITLQFQFGF